jgi:hypothetical protein
MSCLKQSFSNQQLSFALLAKANGVRFIGSSQFICERAPSANSIVSKNGLEYLSYSTTVDYVGAKATCARVGGTLATLYSQVHEDQVRQL